MASNRWSYQVVEVKPKLFAKQAQLVQDMNATIAGVVVVLIVLVVAIAARRRRRG